MSENTQSKVSYKDTLNLPKTDFPIRANHKVDDAELLQRWQNEDIYKKTFESNADKERYVLHDGPPYANGHIHIGHAYNKILKDMVTKSQRMSGKNVPVTPGWDCHGLPIELKVTQENPGLSRHDLQKACRAYAKKWVDVQRQEFKALGVFMDWDRPYETMDFAYEADIMRAFGQFVKEGFIEKKNKTVAWCGSCQTVLASAEIEYKERKDPSIYVKFPLNKEFVAAQFPAIAPAEVSFLVWTTTPWTLPLNRAVLLKPHASYDVLKKDNDYIIVGAALSDAICAQLHIEKQVIYTIKSEELASAMALHPFNGTYVPVILENFVSLEDGTACVHCAPGCGPEDYEVGLKSNLEIYSPVGPDAKYTKGIIPEELIGTSVADAQGWVITKLLENGRLLHKTSIKHSYPQCWRCRNGLIFRATSQWFCNLARKNLKEQALNAITNTISFIPKQSANSLKAAVDSRLEWCLSRQRVWGVPIPALLCKSCNFAYLSNDIVEKVAHGVEKEGVEFWDKVAIEHIIDKDFACPECNAHNWHKEQDILDVWFDSGVSHYAVLKQNPHLAFPADMYLEGRDQARGWFQSSLLTSLALEATPSMKTIVTHGYTVDEKGQKMSKSIGNVVSPQEIIDMMGTDGLRLWASSIDFKDDAVISKQLLQNVQEVFRKIRNTCRFLLSNIYDFDITKDAVPLDKLMFVDTFALVDLKKFNDEALKAYNECKFTAVFHLLGDYCSKNLSSFYLDISKDRLYVERADGFERRSAQTASWYILDTMNKLMAPIMSFTSELVSDNYQKAKSESIHLQSFADLSTLLAELHIEQVEKFDACWQTIFELRSALLKAIEIEREKGLIKHPLEAEIIAYFDLSNKTVADAVAFITAFQNKLGKTAEEFFKDMLVVSRFVIADTQDLLDATEHKQLFAKVKQAEGQKCPRCWHYEETNHEQHLCARCQLVLS